MWHLLFVALVFKRDKTYQKNALVESILTDVFLLVVISLADTHIIEGAYGLTSNVDQL